MSNREQVPQANSGELPPSVCAEAAAWVARLHGSERSPTLEAGFRRWLETHSSHREAFDMATEAWELGGSIPGGALPRVARHSGAAASTGMLHAPNRSRSARSSGTGFLTAAAAIGAVAIGLIWHQVRESAVATDIGEQRTLLLEDGTRVALNTDTRLVVNYDEKLRRVRLENGEALFEVTRDVARPFIVTAGDRKIEALGTSFVVRRDEARIAVTLVEGKGAVAPVEASSASDPIDARRLTLSPGQRLTIAYNAPLKVDQPVLATVTAWRRGEVVLDDVSLADAVDEMNRYSHVKLAVESQEASKIRISGIFRAGDSTRFAQAVAATHELDMIEQPGRIVLSGTPGSLTRSIAEPMTR